MSPVDLPALAARHAFLELEMVRAFRASADLRLAREELRLQEQSAEDGPSSALEDFLAGQHTIASELLELSEELSIVAAYRVVELSVKRHARWIDKTYAHFSWPSFSQLLGGKGINMAALAEAPAVDELRLLNNAIKHEGTVTAELARYPGWTAGARVHPLRQAFDRLSPAIPRFVEALARAIMPVKLGGLRPDVQVWPPKS